LSCIKKSEHKAFIIGSGLMGSSPPQAAKLSAFATFILN
jgi:hypothetical protein